VGNLLLDTPSRGHVRLGDVANVQIRPAQSVIYREDNSRRIDVSANVKNRNLNDVMKDVNARLATVKLPLGYRTVVLGEYAERQAAQGRLFMFAIGAAMGVLLLLVWSFGDIKLGMLGFLTLPSALVGGLLAAYFNGDVISLGSLVGFLTVFGIAARNMIMLISHYQHLERHEGMTFGPELALRGAVERLSPILMTALATGLALVPMVIAGNIPGHEIEYPMAVVILGGLVGSTMLNLFVVPSIYLRFGARKHGGAEQVPASTS
jgi:Cu/Ag efflux pump CusA